MTYCAPGAGTPTAMGAASDGKVYMMAYGRYNMGGKCREHGLHDGAREVLRALCCEHADVVPDEASRRFVKAC